MSLPSFAVQAQWHHFTMRAFLLLACVAVAAHAAYAQPEQWRAHTSLREVTSLDATDGVVWVGTTGGVYSYATGSGEIGRYTGAEGLHGHKVSAVAFDETCGGEGCVWIGHADGVLGRLDIASGAIHTYRDIERANRYAAREITRLVNHGDSLLVATVFGLVVFDKERREVRDTYDQLGSIPMGTPVRDAAVAPDPSGRPALWLATAQGVAYAPLNAVNLKDPSVWTVETAGLPSLDAYAVAVFQGAIYVGTGIDLSRRASDGVYNQLGMTNHPVRDLAVGADLLVGVDRFGILAVNSAGQASRFAPPAYTAPVAVDVVSGGQIWFGDRDEGLISAQLEQQNSLNLVDLRDCSTAEATCYPEGPYFNQFRSVEVDPEGNVWTAGEPAPGSGFHRMDVDGRWADYIGRRVDVLQNRNAFTSLHAQSDGTLWSGSEGHGLARVGIDGEVTVFGRENSTLQSAESTTNPNFIIVGGIGSDQEGRVWVVNVSAPRPLHVISPDGEWASLPFASSCSGITSVRGTYRDIFVDAFGHKWITVVEKNDLRRHIGLLALDTKDTPTDASDDECRLFGLSEERGRGLPSTQVNAVVEDADGFVWVATDEGVAYILNNGIVPSDPGAMFNWPLYADRDQGTYLFNGLKVNDMTVDPANRLWMATDMGVWLIQPANGGYEEVLHFTTDNSPLLDDVANAVEVNPRTGDVYFSTMQGLISYRGDAVMAVDEPRDLFVYPNPVRLQDGGEPSIYIDGLVEETEVLIMTPDGTVVSRFPARGGRARWDGRDSRSQMVPSGVYLVVAVGQNGEGAAYGKVAIIR